MHGTPGSTGQCRSLDFDEEDVLCREVINRSIRTSRNGRLSILKRATSSAACRKGKPNAARGPRSTKYPAAEKRADRVKASPPIKVRPGKVAGWAVLGRPLAQRQCGPPPPRRRQRRARAGPNTTTIGLPQRPSKLRLAKTPRAYALEAHVRPAGVLRGGSGRIDPPPGDHPQGRDARDEEIVAAAGLHQAGDLVDKIGGSAGFRIRVDHHLGGTGAMRVTMVPE